MIKQYLVIDLNSDYKKAMDYKGVKNLLIDTIQEDLLMNIGEYEIAKDCSDELVILAKEEGVELQWIKDLLESYSYKVINLLDLQRDLEDLKQYFAPNEDSLLSCSFRDILNMVNKEVN